jgi:cysteine sulfinate desulfinase/cysteine desulfurase-like protein
MFSKLFKSLKKRIYLDHAAATPICEEVLSVMNEANQKLWANASSLHQEGEVAKQSLDAARLIFPFLSVQVRLKPL